MSDDTRYPLDGWVQGAAARHHYDAERQCCACGFCAWTPEHIAIMAYREAVDSVPVGPTKEGKQP